MKNAKNTKVVAPSISVETLVAAINNAALSRKAALQVELAVGLIHFTLEADGADKTGKANLKALYHAAGYDCMTKADADYVTVNRRLNAVAKLFDKLGSKLVHGWVAGKGDTESVLAYVVTELAAYAFHTLDDVADYCGVASNRTRAARQPQGPAEGKGEGEGAAEGAAERLDLEAVQKAMLAQYGDEILNQFAADLLAAVAGRAAAAATVALAA